MCVGTSGSMATTASPGPFNQSPCDRSSNFCRQRLGQGKTLAAFSAEGRKVPAYLYFVPAREGKSTDGDFSDGVAGKDSPSNYLVRGAA